MQLKSISGNFLLVLPLVLLLALGTSCKKEKKRIEGVYDEPAYTTGRITGYTTRPLKVTYEYEYSVNGLSYEGKEIARGIGQLNTNLVNETFLVVYRQSDPSDSDLNTDYLIADDQEFEDLLKDFESNPPTP